jgi:penicillin amidase
MPDFTSLITPVLSAGLTWLSRRRLPKVDGALCLDGLQAPVEVVRDRWGVPHIFAANEHDLYMAQGFVHAQDRLWQMEANRRAGAGRLAEVVGAAAVEMDRRMRTLTIRRVAEHEATLLDDDIRAVLDAYAAGVNAFIAQGRLPVEFTLLRYKPEPWVVADTLTWIKMMSWYLCADWWAEVSRWQLIKRLGEARVAALYLPYFEHWPRVVPSGVPYTILADTLPERSHPAPAAGNPSATGGMGSNNWVVAGARTTTGMPILANDMHLGMSIPAIWYENHLVGGALNVTGVTFPGTPGVISGHNGRVAWGFTDGMPDVQDLYIEHTRRTHDGRVQVEFDGGWYEAAILREAIRVKGSATVYEDVIVTRHGPIINVLRDDLADAEPLALRWTSLEPDMVLRGLMRMNHARDCREFRETLRDWTAPVQNVVYADIEGTIAYSFPGKIPIRAQGDGTVPVPGWTGDYEWTGYIPFEHLPHIENPPQGYVASANNAVVDDGYPYDLAVRAGSGHRAQRIVELIESCAKMDVAYVRQMHLDVVSPLARIVARHLGQLEVDDPALAAIVNRMRVWDGALRVDSAEAAICGIFIRQMVSLTLSETFAEPEPYRDEAWRWLEHTLPDPHHPGFDLGHGETRDDVMRLALAKTVEALTAECGPDVDDWAWGKLHRMTYGHPLGENKLLATVFNRGPYPAPGDGHTVCAVHQHDLRKTTVTAAPYRMIVDLHDVRNSVSLLTPGQSGQPGSPHYDDQLQAWFTGEYHPMLYAREDVEREARHRLRLSPEG